jgi:hypothetical protein
MQLNQKRNKPESILKLMTTKFKPSSHNFKVMRVRSRHVDSTLGSAGVLRPVMSRRFHRNGYTHVQLDGSIREAKISHGIFQSVIVWIV